MIRSMTGFGEATVETPMGQLRAEIRTVNHRYLSLNVRNPSALDRYEGRAKEWLKPRITRGHVNLTWRFEGDVADAGPALALDPQRAEQYLRVFDELKRRYELPGKVTVEMMARFSDIVVREEQDRPEVPEDAVREVTEQAAAACVVMREREGRALRTDLEGRLDAIAAALAVIEERAPERLTRERDRLRRAVLELAGEAGVDEDRVAREIAIMADRWDISEEIVRLRSHIDHFNGMLEEDAAEPVGKRLSFLVQEMHREANTIGSKANDAEIEHRVVDIKNEIERLREQVDNVE